VPTTNGTLRNTFSLRTEIMEWLVQHLKNEVLISILTPPRQEWHSKRKRLATYVKVKNAWVVVILARKLGVQVARIGQWVVSIIVAVSIES